MKILEGTIEEIVYETPHAGEEKSTSLRQKTQMLVEAGQSTFINDRIGLHRIGNPSTDRPAVSLHLYSPPILKCKKFDETSAHSVLYECGVDSYRGVPVSCRPN